MNRATLERFLAYRASTIHGDRQRGRSGRGHHRAGKTRNLVSEYIALTKPGILTLLLATELGGMLVAEAGVPRIGLLIAALIGGLLSAGGANTSTAGSTATSTPIMTRTRKRGTVTGVIPPNAALAFGLALSMLAC